MRNKNRKDNSFSDDLRISVEIPKNFQNFDGLKNYVSQNNYKVIEITEDHLIFNHPVEKGSDNTIATQSLFEIQGILQENGISSSVIQKSDKIGMTFGAHLPEENSQIQEFMPPKFLLSLSRILIPKQFRECAIGDICENFESDVEKSGKATAKLNLIKNMLSSIYPFAHEFVRSKFQKFAGGKGK